MLNICIFSVSEDLDSFAVNLLVMELMCSCVAVCNSLGSELEREKVIRVEAENKQKELQASDAQHQQKILDLESQIRDLEATKVSICLLLYKYYKRDCVPAGT